MTGRALRVFTSVPVPPDLYLLAFNYFRIARYPCTVSDATEAAYQSSLRAFKSAAKYFDPPLEIVEVKGERSDQTAGSAVVRAREGERMSHRVEGVATRVACDATGKSMSSEKFAAWLYKILVNQCRTILGRRQRRELPAAEWEWDTTPGIVPCAAEQGELRDELARALASLAPDQREAVVLRFADDLTYDEMSAITGAGVSALKMRVQRACARLRELLLETSHA